MLLRLNTAAFYLRTAVLLLPLLAFAGAWAACSLLRAGGEPASAVGAYLLLLIVTMLAWTLMAVRLGVTSVEGLFRPGGGIRPTLAAAVGAYTVALAVLFVTRLVLPGVLLALPGVGLLALAGVWRAVLHHLICRPSAVGRLRLMVVGADEFAHHAAACLAAAPGGCHIAAYLRLPGQPAVIGSPCIAVADLGSFDAGRIDEVVIALPPSRRDELPRVLPLLDPLCRPLRAVLDPGNQQLDRKKIFRFGDLQLVDLSGTPAESADYAILKRAFDVAFSLLALALAAPLMLAIAALIRLTSPGPALFRQERVGLNSRTFAMLKFRTMKVSPGNQSDTRWTTADDPRRTAIGAVLRRTSLDELPQFWNVLKGEMSVVGPRPERPHFVAKFSQEVRQYPRRHRLQAGITGWAQVNGWRGDTSIQKRLDYDLEYLERWSLGFDFRILARTFSSGLFGTHAY